jgi:hypothetical protein
MQAISRKFVAAVIIGLSVAWAIWTVGGLDFSDAAAYRLAADRLLHGQDLYQAAASQDDAFRYAPWFAAVWIPLDALPALVGNVVWGSLLVVASAFSVLPLARERLLVARLLAVLTGGMLAWTVARGNVHPLVMVALVQGIYRRSGPLWIALAASLKAVPIFFALIYVARREWGRAAAALVLTAVLVAPMPFMGWELGTVQPGDSLSLNSLISPTVWAVVAGIVVAGAILTSVTLPRYAPVAAATAAILALPRLLLYDMTYLIVGTGSPAPNTIAVAHGRYQDPPTAGGNGATETMRTPSPE